MDYSNLLYYNQFIIANNTNQDQCMANNNNNYYYPNQQCQYQQDNAVIKQDLTPMFQYNDCNNVLQDDNFSMASFNVLDFTAASFSMHADNSCTTAYDQAYLSPQLSEGCSSTNSSNSYNMYYYQADPVCIDSLFPPVIDHEISKKKRKPTVLTDIRHACPVCSHRSKRRHNLVEHMLTHNPNRPKAFSCNHCSRPFARKYDMKRHEKIHTRSP